MPARAETERLPTRRAWDVIVIGAGPAGGAAAIELARAGVDVLLLERETFPRDKVCGGCVSHSAVRDLRELSVLPDLVNAGAIPLQRFRWAAGDRRVELPLPGGVSVTRSTLDERLLHRAEAEGAHVCTGVTARPGPCRADRRVVQLRRGSKVEEFTANVVIVAAGLAGQSMGDRSPAPPGRFARRSHVGTGTVMAAGAGHAFETGTIHMASGPEGYAGVALAEDDRLVVAGALDPAAIGRRRPAEVCRDLLAAAGWTLPGSEDEGRWRGTPPLTRARSRPFGERTLYVGDAAGYVEPFTGEGIVWALKAGRLAAPFAVRGVRAWTNSLAVDWTRELDRAIRRRQRACRAVTRLIRAPGLVRGALAALDRFPSLALPLTTHLHGGHR